MAEEKCTRLAAAKHPGFEVLSAAKVSGGDFAASDGETIRVPASCRVVGIATPTSDSRVMFQLWLPDGWNGRYSQLGNGGFAGNIDKPSLAAEIRRGNAAAMTDTGHTANQFDASWAQGHPQKIIDYGYRSIKVVSDAARSLVHDYYGVAARRRYFIGCSNGGRQALMAAQRYPLDWDGIIAGSPPVAWTRQLATFAAIQHRLRSDNANWIPAANLPAIQRAAIAACGEAALQCRVDVSRLALTSAQAGTLDFIQTVPLGFDPRFAALPNNWDQWILNPDRNAPSDLAFATQAYRFFILDRPDWQVEEFDAARDFKLASRRKIAGQSLASILDADDTDLRPFERHGGKLILYVGGADAVISPAAGVDYYQRVVRRMGMQRTRRFARLFVVPGMQHCQGGVEPNAFGQAWVAPAARMDGEHDIREALNAWVERASPPASLTAVRYEAGGFREVASRVLYPYPRQPDPIDDVGAVVTQPASDVDRISSSIALHEPMLAARGYAHPGLAGPRWIRGVHRRR
jgi:feruloyl esterase